MAITTIQVDNMSQMDLNNGGGIYSEKARVSARDNPMLVIGLGGTGIDALLRVKYLINKRFILPDGENGRKKDAPNNIRFLGFETNLDEIINKSYNGTKLDANREYQDLTEAGLNSLLSTPSLLPDYIKEWMDDPVKLRSRVKGGTVGANGVRQGGRLLLSLKLNQIISNLTNIIKELLKETKAGQRLEVFILSGVSGGTGSGTFIDVPYIIRGLMESDKIVTMGADRVDILGYIFMPDVLIDKVGDVSYHNVLAVNGYAALKELDYLMNIAQRGERFTQQYGPNLSVNTTLPPYSLCHLISATSANGYIPKAPYDYCMNISAEHIVNFMSNMVDEEGNVFGVHAYRSNIDSGINSMMTNFKPKYSANFIYEIIGASAFELPQVDIMTYLAYGLFKKMRRLYENKPTADEVTDYARRMRLQFSDMESVFGDNIPSPLQNAENKPHYANDSILRNEERLEDDIKAWCDAAAAEYEKTYLNLKSDKVAEIENDYVKIVFKNPKQGPFYAQKLLYNQNGANIIDLVQSYRTEVETNIKESPPRIKRAQEEISQRSTAFKKAVLGKNQKRIDLINSYKKLARLKAEAKRDEYIFKLYDSLYHGLLDLNRRVYNTFVDLLDYLIVLFEKNGDILTSGHRDKSRNVDTYTWKLFNINEPRIKDMLDKEAGNLDIEKCISEITSSMLERSEQWIKEENVDISEFVNDYINDQFSRIATKTMSDYLNTIFDDSAAAKQHVQNKIIPELASHATPLFPTGSAGRLVRLPSWKMIVLPKTAPTVIQAFEESANLGLHGLIPGYILKSDISHRIYWLNLEVGMPMCWHAGLYSYEERYTEVISANSELGVGCHLYQSAKKDWRNLPSPIPDLSWDSKYSNEYVKKKNDRNRRLFDKAFDYGIIRITGNECFIYELERVRIQDIDAIKKPTAQNELNEVRQRLEEVKRGWETATAHAVFASNISSDDLKNNYRESFIRCYELWGLVERETDKYETMIEKLRACDELAEAIAEKNKNLTYFLNAMYTGVIAKEKSIYKYAGDETEEAWNVLNLSTIEVPDERKFPEYALYNAFCRLDDKKKNLVRFKTERLLNNVTDGMLETAKRLRTVCRDHKMSFDQEIAVLEDDSLKPDIYRFYFQALNYYDLVIKNNE